MKKKKFKFSNLFTPTLIILYVLIIIGSYLRLEGIFDNSFAFTYDVGRDLIAVGDIVTGQKLSLIGPTSGLPGVFYGPWWYLMLAPFFVLSSGNPQGIAFFMSLLGILLIPLSFYFGKRLNGDFLALSLAGLAAVSPSLISLSSQIWSPNIAPVFVLLSFILLYKIYSGKDNPIIYFLLGFVTFLNSEAEIIFGVLFTGGVVISVILIKKLTLKPISVIAFLLGTVIVISPKILFEVKHNFLMTQSFIKYFQSGAEKDMVSGGVVDILINRLDIFINEFSYAVAFGNKVAGIILLVATIISIIYFYKRISSNEKKLIITSTIILIVFFAGTLFFAHNIWPHYLVGLPIIYILLVSIALANLKFKLKSYTISYIVLFLLIVINLNPISVYQSFSTSWEGNAAVYRNQLNVVDSIYAQTKNKRFKYVVYTPPLHDYTYRYLFEWRGKKYNMKPSIQADTAYFILEPDPEDPSRLTRWLQERAGDGKIKKSKKYDGGIIVQERFVGNEKN